MSSPWSDDSAGDVGRDRGRAEESDGIPDLFVAGRGDGAGDGAGKNQYSKKRTGSCAARRTVLPRSERNPW